MTTSEPPKDRFCDLVMKGGIASGVVYPRAIAVLAKHYRFKNIGGTSAGAIAASVTAAAEFQRRRTGSDAGFALLADLPRQLGEPVGKHSRLLSLFQPDKPCGRLFDVLAGALNRTTTGRRLAAIVFAMILVYWPATLISLLVATGTFWFSKSVTAGALSMGIATVISIAWAVYRDVTCHVVANNYGLCKGLTTLPTEPEALTPWLHGLLQTAAGLATDGDPLTFGHLWSAPDPPVFARVPPGATPRSIDLQMFTTNLAHGRPYVLPHTDTRARLFYKRSELKEYLPFNVMNWIDAHAIAYARNAHDPEGDPDPEKAERLGLQELPSAQHFPVLLAARLSLSFPLLLAAVPLWAIDYDAKQKDRDFRRCMFSDGGISSNFPMHLFDALLPMWPTFGIQLEAKLPERANLIFLPNKCSEGYGERWNRFDDSTAADAARFGGFLMAIISSMQNWNDTTLARMAGVRDRVVRVRLIAAEGGMNLNMPDQLIEKVAERGVEAAQAIVERFVPIAGATSSDGWDEQRWIRFDVLFRALINRTPGVAAALEANIPHSTPYVALAEGAARESPPCHDKPLTGLEVDAIVRVFHEIQRGSAALTGGSALYSFEPYPASELRVRPPL
jgi:predicted acylesterase/phospholipase RssA